MFRMCQTWGRICGFTAGCCPSSGRVYLHYGGQAREVETLHSSLFAPFLLYSVWFGKAAEVFMLRGEALAFVWWPRGFERAKSGVKPGPSISEVSASEALWSKSSVSHGVYTPRCCEGLLIVSWPFRPSASEKNTGRN